MMVLTYYMVFFYLFLGKSKNFFLQCNVKLSIHLDFPLHCYASLTSLGKAWCATCEADTGEVFMPWDRANERLSFFTRLP